jgi:hypothetical protein
MYKVKRAGICALLLALLIPIKKTVAQNLSIGTPIEDTYRRLQLLGKVDSSISFTVRPLTRSALQLTENLFDPDNSLKSAYPQDNGGLYQTANGYGVVQILPFTIKQQYNTHNPYGWNDGSMIPSAGYQTQVSGGVFAKYKFFSVQFQPEFVYAQNRFFDGFTQAENQQSLWSAYYSVYNATDLPERFGTSAYTRLLPGQSSVRFTFDPVSIGVSTENLWWGPGVRNSLIMSNNATGFLHATLNTTRPVRTPVGSFEGQVVSAKLTNSGQPPLVLGQPGNRDKLYKVKPTDWRYLSGLVLTYNPKWVPGLFLGLTRSFQTYHSDMGSGFNDYFPVFSAFNKKSVDNATNVTSTEDNKRRDEVTSLFLRWLWPDAKAEVYFEYGKNDHNWDLRDSFLDPAHSRSYLFGLKKIYSLSKADQYIQVSAEITQLSSSANDLAIRNAGVWYTHSQVRQGYTNNGEVLGAGVGPGGSFQSLDISWFKGLKRIGLQIERNEHNQDLYYLAFAKGELRRHWVDFSAGLSSDWDYKHFLLSARVVYINQLNYQWKLKEDLSRFYWNYNRSDANNFQFGLNLSYRF